ncbi:MAG: hypothetical protein GF353_15385 [Candidatus Lokiarchaeota archaeon]|nr:hypothetical protein [Candidatus Lokiarchaeota archaeon]
MSNNSDLIMTFDPNTIEALGIQTYSTLPPVIAEVISNSYDAEAQEVSIKLFDEDEKKIIVEDDGHGMTYQEINDEFLKIGRHRRETEGTQKTKNGKRFLIGRKGLGKLAFFGIAEHIKIETIKNSHQNTFELDWDDLKRQGHEDGEYKPKLLEKNVRALKKHGTKFTLSKISRKTNFVPKNLAKSLSKIFLIFDEEDFNVKIYHNGTFILDIRNELRYENIKELFKWEMPLDLKESDTLKNNDYDFKEEIKGKLISSEETISTDMQGIALFSRGKLVNEYSFYDVKATSHGYAYITGFLDISFIDNFERDVIATNRRSLIWELNETIDLREYLTGMIRAFYNKQVEKRKEKKLAEVKKKTGLDFYSWINSLSLHEAKLAKKITDSILAAEGIAIDKTTELLNFMKDSFQFEMFKDLAFELEETGIENAVKIVELFKEWELIEAKEMYKLAIGRIETISTFEKLIEQNAKEVEQIHPFFEKFPWVLDPRINMFRHEVQYVKILNENYPEKELNEKNRRIDFLCTSVSNHVFIIELKRPQHTINYKDIEQAKDYRSFIQDTTLGTERTKPDNVIAYIVGGKANYDDRKTRDEIQSMRDTDKVYIRTYIELLKSATNYHKEFLERYDELASK